MNRLSDVAARACFALASALCVAACSASSSGTNGDTAPSSAPTFGAVSDGAGTTGGDTVIGSITSSTTGVSVTTAVSVGQPATGSSGRPPTDVLNGCNWNYGVILDSAVWVHGSVRIDYNGSVASPIGFQPTVVDLLGITDQVVVGLSDPSGSFDGCNSERGWIHEVQPQSHTSVDVWVLVRDITNTHPTFSLSDLRGLEWHGAASVPVNTSDLTFRASGSHAVTCSSEQRSDSPYRQGLLLFTAPPLAYSVRGPASSCVHA